MRLIYDKDTKEIKGVIPERVTNMIPPTYAGENTTYIDIDYNHLALRRSVLARTLEEQGSNLIGKTLMQKGDTFTFKDKRPKQYMDTVLVDLDDPKLDSDVQKYTKKAEEMGAKVEIEDIGSVIVATIKNKDEIVGTIKLVKKGCCMYSYEEGKVMDRSFYPHYIGFSALLKHLFGKAKWLDMNGFLEKEPGIKTFKKKWGLVKQIEVE